MIVVITKVICKVIIQREANIPFNLVASNLLSSAKENEMTCGLWVGFLRELCSNLVRLKHSITKKTTIKELSIHQQRFIVFLLKCNWHTISY